MVKLQLAVPGNYELTESDTQKKISDKEVFEIKDGATATFDFTHHEKYGTIHGTAKLDSDGNIVDYSINVRDYEKSDFARVFINEIINGGAES